jgi:outer membrane protein insertion porin family
MKKRKIWQPLAASILTSLLLVSPVYAEVSVSQPLETKPKVETTEGKVEVAPLSKSVMPEASLQNVQSKAVDNAAKAAPYVGSLVAKVSLIGIDNLDPEKIKEVLKMKPGTTLTADGFAEDIRALYETGLFYEITPVFREVPEGVQIDYNIMENPAFTQLDVEGNTKISTDEIKKMVDIPKGQVLNTKKVNEGARKIESEYSKQGYILARVNDIRLLPNGHLAILINEGVVEDFKINGNTKTKDYVVTREMKLKKGQPFNAKAARRSMQRIYNLGYFEDVNIKLNPGQQPNTVVVEITVVEMSTGSFGIGAGYSDADGILGMISIGDKNFRGTGDKVNLRWEFGEDDVYNKNYELSYVRPWIDSRETAMGVTVYDMTNEYVDYNRDSDEIARYYKKRRGQEVSFSRVTDNEFITDSIVLKNRDDIYVKPVSGYTYQYFEGYDRDGTQQSAAVIAARQAENFGLTRSVTFARTLDSRDNIYDPHEGKRNNYSVEVASFGGDFSFQKYSADYRYYYRQGVDNVIAVNLGIGYANGDMPLSQRFSVGGSDTLRGYRDDVFKGNSMLRGSVEYRVPLVKKVQGVAFTDAGYAWSKDYGENSFDLGRMKYSAGVGLRINSPLGPLRLDYGIPLNGGNGGRFHFSFGGQF